MNAENAGSGENTDSKDIGEEVLEAWKHPKFAFLLGALFGIILVGSIIVSPPTTAQQAGPDMVGERVVQHYQNIAPAGLTYELVDVTSHNSDMYEVTIEVSRGTVTSTETVYTTENGKWVFTQPPEHVQPQLAK